MRKYIKQIFLFIISILYLGGLTIRPVYAGGVEFVISSENASPGENITLSIVNYSGIAVTSGQFDLVYDSERFELVEATLFQESVMPFYFEEGVTNKFRISAIPLSPDQAYSDQNIAAITFKLKDTADGQATFELVKSKIGYGSIYENVQNLEVSGTTAGVNIMNPEPDESVDPEIEISEKPDPDPPQEPAEEDHLEPEDPEPTESSEPTESTAEPSEPSEPGESTEPDESVEPTESSELTDTTEITEFTEPSEPTEPMTTMRLEELLDSDEENNLSENESQETNPMTSEVIQIETAATTQDVIRIISTLAPVTAETTTASITEPAMSQTEVQSVETVQTMALVAITSADTEEVIQNNTATATDQIQTVTTQTEPTTSAVNAKTIPTTVQQSVENSQNTEITSINIEEQKQAKQEQAFKLTGNELNLHNKLMLGGLAVTAIGSLGALIFLIIKNNLRLR